MRLAALDLGSNTLKITAAELGADGRLRVLGEAARITRVGQGLDTHGRLAPEAIARTLLALEELVTFARDLGATEIGCVGTAGLRGAENAGELLDAARARFGLEVEVIDGLREAGLAFRAPIESYGPGPLIVTDIGGRSTEVVVGDAHGITARVSLEIGSVRLTERFLAHDPPTPEEREALRAHLATLFCELPAAPSSSTLVGVSGTVLSLMGLELDVDTMEETVQRGEGQHLSRGAVHRILEDLAARPASARVRGSVLPEGRADVIVAGAHILLALLEHYASASVLVSNRGVRYGLLFELAERAGLTRTAG